VKEITGSVELENAFKELGINAKNTYRAKDLDYSDFQCVYELSEEDYNLLNGFSDSDYWNPDNKPIWKDNWGWWRHAKGSNMTSGLRRYNINHHYINAWDGSGREDFEEENKSLPVDDRWYKPRKYDNLMQYFWNEIRASTEKNVTALATDLAKYNNLTLGQLFTKYVG